MNDPDDGGRGSAHQGSSTEPQPDGAGVDGGKRPRTGALGRAWRALGRALRSAPAGTGRDQAPTIDDAATAAVEHKGAGRPVADSVRAPVEAQLGTDLSAARVHDDPLAQQASAAIGARAFAHGPDVFLGAGESEGDAGLMAHELTHVAQQGAGGARRLQRKVQVGDANSPAEAHADAVAGAVTSGARPPQLIVDDAPVTGGQMLKSTFLEQLRPQITAVADAELGVLGAVSYCPYIEYYFRRYGAQPAAALEALLRRYAPATGAVKSAAAMMPIILERVREGVRAWRQTGEPPADLPADVGAPPVAGAAANTAHAKLTAAGDSSIEALQAELGPGQPLDGATASRMRDALGTPFDHVRIHTGDVAARKASDVGAAAFAVGSDVAFASGRYQPGTLDGDVLLAHELAHVAQQPASTDPVARKKKIEGESGEAEADADEAALGAANRLWGGARAAVGKIGPALRSDVQLQRCGDTPPTGASVGAWANKVVAHQKKTVITAGPVGAQAAEFDEPVTATSAISVQKTEAAALAAVKMSGKPGTVTIENGLYVAYNVDHLDYAGKDPEVTLAGPAKVEPPRCEPGIVALVTKQHVVVRPGAYDPAARAPQETSAKQHLGEIGDPFQGYKDAVANGGKLDGADNATLLKAFEASLTDTAFSVLAESQRTVESKKPKFDAGTAGVPDPERKLIRDTAARLLPVQKEMEAAERNKDGALALIRSPGGGEIGGRELQKWSGELTRLRALRNMIRQDYPMLARFDTRKLEEFVAKPDDGSQLQVLDAEFPQILKDIETTRQNIIGGKIDLWESREIVEAAMVGLGIDDPAKRKVITDKQKEHARNNTIKSVVKMILSIGLGLGALAVGGPVGVAMAAGALAVDLGDALHETEQYSVKQAAVNTDPDPSKSIMDPSQAGSLGWLIVAWVGVGLDIHGVKTAVAAIEAGAKTIPQAADELGKLQASTKGGNAAEITEKLRLAAGELKAGEVLTELNKVGLSRRLNVAIEIDKGLAESEVRIYYTVEKATGKVEVTGMRCGAKAALADILAHEGVLRLMRRYEGLTGKIRELIDKFRSLLGKKTLEEVFQPGSRAYESYLEAQKLPAMIEARTSKFGPHLSKDAEAALRQDVEFLESELARHRQVVEQAVVEAGEGFIAKAGDRTLDVINDAGGKYGKGYSLPGLEKKTPPFTLADIEGSAYYYRVENGKPILQRKAGKVGEGGKKPELLEGKPSGKFLPTEETRAEEAARLVKSMDAPTQKAYQELVERLAREEPAAKVVPIEGLNATGRSIEQVTQEFGNGAFRSELVELLNDALVRKGIATGKEARKMATEAADAVMKHEIVVVRGTDQLRAFNYRGNFKTATGFIVEAEEDLHHIIPLYLGGGHLPGVPDKIGNLIAVDAETHKALHNLMDTVQFNQRGVTLAPNAIQNTAELTFPHGAAILHANGTITFDALKGAGH